MKRYKRLGLLFGALVAACIATVGVISYEEYQEQIKNTDEIIMALSGESVQALSWEYEGETLSFHKEEGWLYDGDEAFPVDEEKINELLGVFAEFGASFIIEEVEDWGQYGLKDPLCTIQITTAQGEEAADGAEASQEEGSAYTYEILLGNYSNMDSQRYVSIGDGNAYLVSNDPLEYYDALLDDMMKHDETPDFEQIIDVVFTGAEEYRVFYEEESVNTYCAEDVYFTERDGETLPLDTSRVDAYLAAVSGLSPTDYVTYKATEEQLQDYGLDDPELTIEVNYATGTEEETAEETFVLHLSRDPEEREAEAAGDSASEAWPEEEDGSSEDDNAVNDAAGETDASEEEEEITAYARVGESPVVYRLSSYNYTALMAASYDDLRHLEVLPADFADIHQIDVSLEGSEYTLAREGEEEEAEWKYGDETAAVEDLETALSALMAAEFTTEEAKEKGEKQEIALTVYLDNEYHPQVEIGLYRYDGAYCLAVVDGKPVSLVNRSEAVALVEAVNAIVLGQS